MLNVKKNLRPRNEIFASVKTTLWRQITPCNEFTINLLDTEESVCKFAASEYRENDSPRVHVLRNPPLFSQAVSRHFGVEDVEKSPRNFVEVITISFVSFVSIQRTRTELNYKVRRFKNF